MVVPLFMKPCCSTIRFHQSNFGGGGAGRAGLQIGSDASGFIETTEALLGLAFALLELMMSYGLDAGETALAAAEVEAAEERLIV